MTRTRKQTPQHKQAEYRKLEQTFEGEMARTKAKRQAQNVAVIRNEAEQRLNELLGQDAVAKEARQNEVVEKAKDTALSVQTNPNTNPIAPLLWWTGCTLDKYIPVSDLASPSRQAQLRTFVLAAPMIANAISVMAKKVQALQWSVEGGRNLANKWQKILNNFDDGKGWDTFVARWVRAYCESDRGGYAEIIRQAPGWAIDDKGLLTPRGVAAMEKGADAAWPIVGSKIIDPIQCYPTSGKEFPLLYVNPHTGRQHKLRAYQFMHLVDMPSVDDAMPGMGLCATSRAIWAAQEDRMIIRYAMEKMSENPGAGIITANVAPNVLQSAVQSMENERMARGVVYYKGVVFLPILNPEGTASLDFLSFSGLPDNFNRLEVYNVIKEIVATSFGLDVLELGSLPGGGLGTSQQSTVAAAKSHGKAIGSIIQQIEREFRYKLLPEALEFHLSKHDPEEKMEDAQVNSIYFTQAAQMLQVGAWTPALANQYLADMGAIPQEYIPEDATPNIEVEDTEATDLEETPAAGEIPETPEETTPEATAQKHAHAHAEPKVKVYKDGRAVYIQVKSIAVRQFEPLTPRRGNLRPLTAKDAEISEEDIKRANKKWDMLMPEFAGLLDARNVTK